MRRIAERGAVAAGAIMVACLFSAGAASAQTADCGNPAFPSPPLGDAVLLDGFAVEGKISCAQVGATNIATVNGAKVTLPLSVLINTRDPREGRKDVTWSCLVNPTATCFPGRPIPNRTYTDASGNTVVGPLTVLGGTLKGSGNVVRDASGNATLVAVNGTADAPGATFEFGEHLLIGVFDFDAAGTLFVNGQEFRMNDDPRLPYYSDTGPDDGILFDIGGRQIKLVDLMQERFKGTLIAVGGYFAKDESGVDVLWGTSVETEAFALGPTGDTIVVERGEYRARTRLLRVAGQVVSPDGILPPSVTVFLPGEAVPDGTCSGTQLQGTAPVDAAGLFDYRRVQPATLVVSPGMTGCVRSTAPSIGSSTYNVTVR